MLCRTRRRNRQHRWYNAFCYFGVYACAVDVFFTVCFQGIFDTKLRKLGEGNIRNKRKRFEPVIAPSVTDERDRYLKMMKRVVTPNADASVDVEKVNERVVVFTLTIRIRARTQAAKRQRQIDHVVGKRRDIESRAVRDTQRRSKQGGLRQKAKK
jgi:hypothetical protein